RLFPPSSAGDPLPAWLPEMMALVHEELRRCRADAPDQTAANQKELQELERQLAGWSMTLGEPALPATVRADIVAHYEQAKTRQQQLMHAIADKMALEHHVTEMLDERVLIQRLHELSEMLAKFNPTLVNLELSKHIERIDCFADGRVEMRGTLLGLFEGAV